MNKIAEVDISEQIDNSWNKDTALAIKCGGINYSVKIRAKDKNDLKSKFIKKISKKKGKEYKDNRRVIVKIYCFMLYHLLKISNGLAKEVKICNDVSPKWAVSQGIDLICKEYDEQSIHNKIKITFRKDGDSKSAAHHFAKDVAKGRKPANLTLDKHHLDKLKSIIRKE